MEDGKEIKKRLKEDASAAKAGTDKQSSDRKRKFQSEEQQADAHVDANMAPHASSATAASDERVESKQSEVLSHYEVEPLTNPRGKKKRGAELQKILLDTPAESRTTSSYVAINQRLVSLMPSADKPSLAMPASSRSVKYARSQTEHPASTVGDKSVNKMNNYANNIKDVAPAGSKVKSVAKEAHKRENTYNFGLNLPSPAISAKKLLGKADVQREIASSKAKQQLDDILLKHKLSAIKSIVTEVQSKSELHVLKVNVEQLTTEYPCLIVSKSADFIFHKTMIDGKVVNNYDVAYTRFVTHLLITCINKNLYDKAVGLAFERRQSFGFLVPTATDVGNGIRLSLGLIPNRAWKDCVIQGIRDCDLLLQKLWKNEFIIPHSQANMAGKMGKPFSEFRSGHIDSDAHILMTNLLIPEIPFHSATRENKKLSSEVDAQLLTKEEHARENPKPLSRQAAPFGMNYEYDDLEHDLADDADDEREVGDESDDDIDSDGQGTIAQLDASPLSHATSQVARSMFDEFKNDGVADESYQALIDFFANMKQERDLKSGVDKFLSVLGKYHKDAMAYHSQLIEKMNYQFSQVTQESLPDNEFKIIVEKLIQFYNILLGVPVTEKLGLSTTMLAKEKMVTTQHYMNTLLACMDNFQKKVYTDVMELREIAVTSESDAAHYSNHQALINAEKKYYTPCGMSALSAPLFAYAIAANGYFPMIHYAVEGSAYFELAGWANSHLKQFAEPIKLASSQAESDVAPMEIDNGVQARMVEQKEEDTKLTKASAPYQKVNILYVDANPCVSDQRSMVDIDTIIKNYAGSVEENAPPPKMIVIDVTSSTKDKMDNIIASWMKTKIPLLCFASSVIKNGEIGLDLATLGKNKLFINPNCEKQTQDKSMEIANVLRDITQGTSSPMAILLTRELRQAADHIATQTTEEHRIDNDDDGSRLSFH